MTTTIIIPKRRQERRDTAANWAAINPILASGEWGFETDTRKIKIGDGTTAWNALAYFGIYTAADLPYDNTASGMAATDVQAAIDELEAAGSAGTDLRAVAHFFDECYFAAVTTAGWVATVASGTVAVQQSVTGMVGAYGLTSGGSIGNRAEIIAPGFKVALGTGEIRAFFRVQPQHLPSGSQNSWYDLGLFDSGGTTSTYAIRFGARDTYATGNWYLNYLHPVGGTVVSTTAITLTPGAIVKIEIVVAADGSSVSVYTNGVLRDTLALPASFVAMHPGILSRKSGANGASSTLYVDKVLVEQDQ